MLTTTASHGPEHHRVLERLLLALGHGVHHGLGVLADAELGRAHQVADVLDDEEVEVGEREAGQAGAHHHGIEVALATEAGAGVDQRHRRAESGQPVGVDAGGDVALQDPDARPPPQLPQRALQQRPPRRRPQTT